MRPEVRALFPAYVAGAELCSPELAEPLHPEEAAHVQKAVEKRRTEFALGRTCARRALAQLGIEAPVLLALPDRSVAWPDAAWGSITHADRYCAAVAVLRSEARGIGMDAEEKTRVHQRLWKQIAGARETAWLDAAGSEDASLLRAALLFSAKETFYKAQFCVTRAWVGFHDAEVRIDEHGGFEIELLVDVANVLERGSVYAGKYAVLEEHVVTGMVIV